MIRSTLSHQLRVTKSSFATLNPLRTALLLLLLLSTTGSGQTSQTTTDKMTPSGITPGAPAGSYPLSDIESINLYNGNLDFQLPLLVLGGRGLAVRGIVLSLNTKKWRVREEHTETTDKYSPTTVNWGNVNVGYTAGKLQGRQSGWSSRTCPNPSQTRYHYTNTKLTFVTPDGTEYDLRDQLSDGQPMMANQCGGIQGASRGTIFKTNDGSGVTFISDSQIFDKTSIPTGQAGSWNLIVSGFLLLRDGTRYRIDSGNVSWIRDRNGNLVYSQTDAINRQITMTTLPDNSDQITYRGYQGALRTITITRTDLGSALRDGYFLQTHAQLFPELVGGFNLGTYNPSVVSSVILPDGRSYQFRYNSYGELARVLLPTDGAIEYDMTAGSGVVESAGRYQIYRRVIERRTYVDGITLEGRTTYTANGSTTTVSHYNSAGTLLAREAHSYHGNAADSLFVPVEGGFYSTWLEGREHTTSYFAADGVTVLKTVTNTWEQRAPVSWYPSQYHNAGNEPANDPRITQTVTTLVDTNQVSKTTYSYDQYNNQTDSYEYGYGTGAAGALVRHTHIDYLTTNPVNGTDYTASGVYLRSLPSQISVFDAGGVERSRQTFEYDNYTADSNHGPLTDRSNITGHDIEFTTNYKTRGNLTASTKYLLTNGTVTGSVTAYSQFDIAGNVTKAIDGRGYATIIDYDDRFGIPDGEVRSNTAPSELAGLSSFAFATKLTNALGQTVYGQYDYHLGQSVDGEDVNGVVASAYYNDALDRPTQVRRAVATTAASQSTFDYDDANRTITVTSDLNVNNDNALLTRTLYDGLGRTIETRQYESGTNYIAVQTQYDGLGRAYKSSNPFRPWQSESAVWTTNVFDGLGRVTSVTTPDNAVVTTSYSGNTVTITDQAGKVRKSVTDALGRLTDVFEDPLGALNYQTTYAYDTLDSLVKVSQGSQERFFMYDSLKRLIRAKNPEQGTLSSLALADPVTGNSDWSIGYEYDANGNLAKKTDPRGVESTHVYDELNRNTTIDYSDTISISPDVTRLYDGAIKGKGRLWKSYAGGTETTGSNVERTVIDSYDALGRPLVLAQSFKLNNNWKPPYQITRTYNLTGAVTSQIYPSGHFVNYNYDNAGRLADKDATNLAFNGNLGDGNPRTYSRGVTYASAGQMKQEQFGTTTSVYNKRLHNSRQQLSEILLSTTGGDDSWNRGKIVNDFSLECSGVGCNALDNNGNLRKQTVHIPANGQTPATSWYQQYDYDELNRLKRVHEYTGNSALDWQQEYLYDRWGNRRIDTNVTKTFGTGINNKAFAVEDATNRLYAPTDLALADAQRSIRYDAAGNQIKDTYTGYGTASFDAENHITTIQDKNGGTANYTYNADGQRTRRKISNQETWHIYGIDAELLAEYPAGGAANVPQKEYGYRNGELLVTGAPPPTTRKNFALRSNGGSASASSEISAGCSTWPARGAIDGDRKGAYWGNNGGWADSSSGSFSNDWFQVDFDSAKTIDELDIFTVQDNPTNPSEPTETMIFTTYGLTAYSVSYWNGSTWTNIPEATVVGNNKVWRKFTFSPITTTKIRVYPQAAIDNGFSRLTEVEAWGAVTMPAKTNVALRSNGGVATASSEISAGCDTWPARGANDGDRKGAYWGNTGGWADSNAGNFSNDWLQIDFNGNKTIDEIDVFTLQDNYANPIEPTETTTFSTYGLTAFDVSYWNGSSWVQITETVVTGNNKVWRKLTFNPITTSKIRVYGRAAIDNGFSRISELEAWSPTESSAETGVQWLVTDHLGTPRMIIDQTGSLANVKRHDYQPFGEEIFSSVGKRPSSPGYADGDGVRQQFTAKERDVETELDYFSARYYSGFQGRFTTVDPLMASGIAVDPQSWNRYVYAGNSPLRYIDDDGLIRRDASGNVVFHVDVALTVAKGSAIEPIAARGRRYNGQWGYIETDDGRRIEAFRSADSDMSADSNCHGLTFADGQYFVDNPQVPTILQGDNYQETNEPQVGDVVVYMEGNEIVHTATVHTIGKDGKVSLIAGLGGVQINATATTPEDGWINRNAIFKVYHKRGDARTSEQRANHARTVANFDKRWARAARNAERERNRNLRRLGSPPPVPKRKKK